ncbi:MAG: flavin reductase [Prevotella sp.]|nr:flavin reductase [Prevotella sp.]MCM1074657.1 flavin reductase [Ruminococcus sp.]
MTLKQLNPVEIDGKLIEMIGNQWMLVTSGNIDSFNMMTASWGFMGYIWGFPAAMCVVRPTRYTKEWLDKTHSYTLTFFPEKYKSILQNLGTKSGRDMDKMHKSGLTPIQLPTGDVGYEEATLTLVCRVAYEQDMTEAAFLDKTIMPRWYTKGATDLHTMYIGQITAAFQKHNSMF